MKVGTSLSRCVRDIFNDVVILSDVLVVIARTDFDPEDDNQWDNIWCGYSGDGSGSVWSLPEWYGYAEHEQAFRDICIDLKKQGKLHQPRQYGAHPPRLNEYWYDVVLTSLTHQDNPSAKKAWDKYKMIAGLI